MKSPTPAPSALRGMTLLAFGRPAGLALFRATPEGFLASLAPLLALPLAGALLIGLGGHPGLAVLVVLVTLVSQLAPPVLSHTVARAWGQDAGWLRYATAYNWCQWAVLAVTLTMLLFLGALTGAPVNDVLASPAFGFLSLAYILWLHWLIARHGLALPIGRAAALVMLVGIGTMLLVIGPSVVQGLLERYAGSA